MKISSFLAILIALSIFISSCDETTNPSSDEYLIDKTISVSTTEQVVESGTEFKMIFPANSVSGEITLKIKKEGSYPTFNIPNAKLGSNTYRIKFSGNTAFASPVKIIINYDKSQIPAGKTAAEIIQAYIYANGNWKLATYQLDETNSKIIISISNLETPKTNKDKPEFQGDGDLIISDGTNSINDSGQNDGIPVTIGTQIWMTKNLDVDKYRNGDPIPQVTDPVQWANLTTGAWCYYNNDPAIGAVYGKLYNWYAVNDPRGLAPSGYHVPSDAEWTILTNYLGGEIVAGGKLKETGTTHWYSPNEGATNSSGFSALPGGYRYYNGNFEYLSYLGDWWSATEGGEAYARYSSLHYNYALVVESYLISKVVGYSVRCVRD